MLTYISKSIVSTLALSIAMLSLTACAGLFDKDNTPEPKPLAQITPEIKPLLMWTSRPNSGSADEFLKMSPGITSTAIYTTSVKGVVSSTNKADGRTLWKIDLKTPLTTGAGTGDGIVVVGNRYGDVFALSENDGHLLWQYKSPGELIARPAIANGLVVIKAINGQLHALSSRDGHDIWRFQQVEPTLILRGSSTPLLRSHYVFAGFANGNLSKIGAKNGQVYWTQPIAIPEGGFAIQRMVDIDADPVILGDRIYAATYQGKISSLDWESGRPLWSHDISSYTGMSADSNTVFVSDAKSQVWALAANSGLVNWRQPDLLARHVSGPALMGNYIVVGDGQGYLHWLSKRDGHIVAREFVGAPVISTPLTDNNVLYALTTNGSLVAYRLD